jgi:hypothetical protein
VIDNKSKNDITYMTQIQLLFDQERKSLKPGDTELLKRVIRSEEGTLTSYIKKLEKDLNLNFETSIEVNDNFKPFMNNELNNSFETPATLN